MKQLFIVFFSLLLFSVAAQEESVVLVIINQDAQIVLDGIDKGAAKAGAAFRVSSTAGEHYLEAKNASGQVKGEVLLLEAGKQKIQKLEFVSEAPVGVGEVASVADINFNLPGLLEVMGWQSNNPGKQYAHPEFYYAFEKGDEIILDVSMSNAKGTNTINVSTYPNNVVRFTNNAFVELKEASFKVPERSIYKFTFTTNHAFARNCFLKVKRKPGSPQTAGFNSNVSLKRILTPVVVAEAQNFFVNSGSNATFMGGKSRVLLPLQLPENTIEWIYRFSASRNQADVDNVKQNFKLFSEVGTLLLGLTGPAAKVGSVAVDKLSQPPGSNYCDIYLLTHESGQLFENKQEGKWQYYQDASRLNFTSGNVKVVCCNTGSFILGIKNPDSSYGVNVLMEVVAITAREDYVMEEN